MTEQLSLTHSLTHSQGNPESKAGELAFNRKREELGGAEPESTGRTLEVQSVEASHCLYCYSL